MSAAFVIALPLALLLPSPAPAQFAVARTVRAAPPRLGLFGRFRQKRAVEAAPQIEVGAEIPNVDVEIVPRTMLDDEPEEECEVRPIGDALGPGKTILVGMPGAFTPTCTDAHLPGYMNRAAQFAQVGVSNIGVVTTNDRFVNEAWTKALEACTGKPSTLDMYSDGDGDLVKALGLVDDMGFGLGLRSKRFALVVEDGVVAHVATDPGMDEMRETSAEKILRVVTPAPDYSGIESEVDPAVLAVAGALAAAALAYFAQNPPA